jgi:hypothetical protein
MVRRAPGRPATWGTQLTTSAAQGRGLAVHLIAGSPGRGRTGHLVTNVGPHAANVLVLQGMGDYDFVPETG